MAKKASRKALTAGRGMKRDATTGRFVGLIDEADAREFRKAARAFTAKATSSKAHAIEALKASGYLTATGQVAKRYR
jgi:hypothetical protein